MSTDEVEIIDYLSVLWKRKLLVLLGMLAALLCAVVVSIMAPKVYRCEGIIEIGHVNGLPMASPLSAQVFFRTEPLAASFLKARGEDLSADEFSFKTDAIGGSGYIRLTIDSPVRRLLPDLVSYAAEALAESHRPIYENGRKQIDDSIRHMEEAVKALETRLEEMRRILREEFSRPGSEKRDYYFYLNTIQDKEFQLLRLQNQRDELILNSGKDDPTPTRLSGAPFMKPEMLKPDWTLNLIIGVLIGLLVSVCLAYVLEYREMRRSLR